MKKNISKHLNLKNFLSSIFLLCILSCQNTPSQNVLVNFTAMPPAPSWVEFTRKPILEKKESDFLVSDEFVTKALQQKKYIDRVQAWKETNQVP